jgi:hypothetical protein
MVFTKSVKLHLRATRRRPQKLHRFIISFWRSPHPQYNQVSRISTHEKLRFSCNFSLFEGLLSGKKSASSIPAMKSIILFSAAILFAALAALSSSSCSNSNSTTENGSNDTTHLELSRQVIVLKSSDSLPTDSIQIWLSCGCPFTLTKAGEGGDTNQFSVISLTPNMSRVTPHYLSPLAQFEEVVTPASAWFAFSAVDPWGKTQYDTLFLSRD